VETQSALIFNDLQGEFYDPRAWEVMLQVGEYVRPDVLVSNGDFVDWPSMSVKYNQRAQKGQYALSFKKSIGQSRAKVVELAKRIPAKRKLWNDGNHEWRIFRALHVIPQISQLLQLDGIRVATSIPSILGVEAHGFRYSGEYPAGCWLFGTRNPATDVWVEHGYISRKQAGYAATNMRADRMTNFAMGHVERLSLSYKHVVGGRNLFAMECGNLNILGLPKKGDARYSSAPFNVGDYADRQQGFGLVFRRGKDLFPYTVPIHNGTAVWGGKVFSA
jgi:hypothetical protein